MVLEMRQGSVQRGERILLVDDWIETGAQVQAAVCLIERQKGLMVGITAIHIDVGSGSHALLSRYFCHSVWRDMKE